MILSLAILIFVTVQRVSELVLASRNTRLLLAQGGVETGQEHYPLIVGLHTAWLAGLWWLGWNKPADFFWLTLYALLQGLRAWTLLTLGSRWTTRIIILPGAPLVRRGPYRFLSHPNYAVVVGEIAVLPLAFGLWEVALVFSLLNAAVLLIRIRAEGRALQSRAPSRTEGV